MFGIIATHFTHWVREVMHLEGCECRIVVPQPAISRRRFSWFPFIVCTPLLLATHNVIPIPHTSTLKVDVVVVGGVGRFLIQPTLKTTTTSHRTSRSRTHIVTSHGAMHLLRWIHAVMHDEILQRPIVSQAATSGCVDRPPSLNACNMIT